MQRVILGKCTIEALDAELGHTPEVGFNSSPESVVLGLHLTDSGLQDTVSDRGSMHSMYSTHSFGEEDIYPATSMRKVVGMSLVGLAGRGIFRRASTERADPSLRILARDAALRASTESLRNEVAVNKRFNNPPEPESQSPDEEAK
jgi:hypothetical protein